MAISVFSTIFLQGKAGTASGRLFASNHPLAGFFHVAERYAIYPPSHGPQRIITLQDGYYKVIGASFNNHETYLAALTSPLERTLIDQSYEQYIKPAIFAYETEHVLHDFLADLPLAPTGEKRALGRAVQAEASLRPENKAKPDVKPECGLLWSKIAAQLAKTI